MATEHHKQLDIHLNGWLGLLMSAPAVLELPLDDNLLKVLSSESRREILRLLAERRMTGAELAARLGLGKPAVSEHLKKLQDSGLIDRFDDAERRWVYYGLSQHGRSILEPQRVRFYLVLAVAALGLMLGMALALGVVAFLQSHGASGPIVGSQAGTQDGDGALGVASLPTGQHRAVPATTASTNTQPTRAAPVGGVLTKTYVPEPDPVNSAVATVDNQTYRLLLPNSEPVSAGSINKQTLYIERLDPTNHTIVVSIVPPAGNVSRVVAALNLTQGVGGLVPASGLPGVAPTPGSIGTVLNTTTSAVSKITGTQTSTTAAPVTGRVTSTTRTTNPSTNASVGALTTSVGNATLSASLPEKLHVLDATINASAVPSIDSVPYSPENLTASLAFGTPARVADEEVAPAPLEQLTGPFTATFTGSDEPVAAVASSASSNGTTALPVLAHDGVGNAAQGKPMPAAPFVASGPGGEIVHQVPRDNTFVVLAALLTAALVAGLARTRRS